MQRCEKRIGFQCDYITEQFLCVYEHALGTSNIMTVASFNFFEYFMWSDVAPSVTWFGGCSNLLSARFSFWLAERGSRCCGDWHTR